MFSLKVEMLNAAGAESALIKFEVDQVLDKTAASFDADLLFCLNLLQESTGVVGLHASDATREDFIGTIVLDWEVFPPGHADAVIATFTKGQGESQAPVTAIPPPPQGRKCGRLLRATGTTQ